MAAAAAAQALEAGWQTAMAECDFSPETEVAPGIKKNLVWVTGIEDYKRVDESGELQEADEGWFADTDIEKINDSEGQQMPRLFMN